MRHRPAPHPMLVAVLAAACLLAACGSGSSRSAPRASITVFAAASLTEAFGRAKATLAASEPGLVVTYNLGGSQALVTQLQQGAPADVVALADTATMQKLVDAGLVEAPAPFARNVLEIAVAPGNPKAITGLRDLARPGLTVVLAAPQVPAGSYARQALAKAGATVDPRSEEQDVKSALTKVTSGEADATVVYATDVAAAGAKATGVTIPDAENVVATYPIAVVKATKDHAAAVAFVTSAISGDVQRALRDAGFSAP